MDAKELYCYVAETLFVYFHISFLKSSIRKKINVIVLTLPDGSYRQRKGPILTIGSRQVHYFFWFKPCYSLVWHHQSSFSSFWEEKWSGILSISYL